MYPMHVIHVIGEPFEPITVNDEQELRVAIALLRELKDVSKHDMGLEWCYTDAGFECQCGLVKGTYGFNCR
jgi:hypothetical protein